MKKYETFWTNCSKCGTDVERDMRWEGRKHECSKCREKRYLDYRREKDEVFKKICDKARLKHKSVFAVGKKEGRRTYQILEDLFNAGKL